MPSPHCRPSPGRALALAVAALAATPSTARAETIAVSPGTVAAIHAALDRAAPGDVIELAPGTYAGTLVVTRSGAPDRPIVIRGASSDPARRAVIDPGGAAGQSGREGARITGAAWVTLENLRFVNAWRDVVAVTDSQYVTVRACAFDGTGRTAVAQRGAGSHHVLLEESSWTQDPRVYTTWDWDELHHGAIDYWNGGIYGGDGAGGAVVRRNTVRHVFNGLRWSLGAAATARWQQSNNEVYENDFEYARDNVIEPENFTHNLHVYRNALNNCAHGPVSIDLVDGGPIYVWGNVGRFAEPGGADRSETPYTTYKFGDYAGGNLDAPLYILHNAWNYRTAFGGTSGSGASAEDHVRHFNNAFSFLDGRGLGLTGWLGQDTEIDYDCSSAAFPTAATASGFESHGVVGEPRFADVAAGDYRLAAGSPCVDRGRVVAGFTLWYEGAAPDMGAYENGRAVHGAPFEYSAPPGGARYAERPRIVRAFARGRQLAVFFSTGLQPSTLTAAAVSLSVGGRAIAVERVAFPGSARAPVLTLAEPVADGATVDFAFAPLPAGANGETATLWGADRRVVQIPESATLVGEMAALFAAAPAPGDAGADGGDASGADGGGGGSDGGLPDARGDDASGRSGGGPRGCACTTAPRPTRSPLAAIAPAASFALALGARRRRARRAP